MVKNAILKTMIEEQIVELMVKTQVDNVYMIDGTTTLASKLAEMIVAINGKATPDDIQEAIKDLPTSENVAALISAAVTALKGGVAEEYDTLNKLATAISGEITRATGVEEGLQNAIDAINDADTGILKQSKDYTDTEIAGVKAEIAGALHFKGTVDYVSELPTDAEQGDVYQVRYRGESGTTPLDAEYAFNGTEWTELGSVVDLSAYSTTEQMNTAISTAKAEAIADAEGKITALENGAVKDNADNITALEGTVAALPGIKVSASQPADLKAGDIWAQIID